MKIIVCGGGTGGHIYPALAIADEFKKQSAQNEILYIGTTHGIESKIVPEYGYVFEGLDMRGFIRKINPENIKRVWKAGVALIKARRIIKKFQPDIVIGTGGYVCGPVVYVASRMGCFTAIHEQNAFPGLTNKILASKVNRIFVGYEEAIKQFDNQKAAIHTGNPVRKRILEISKKEAREQLGLKTHQKMILIMAGSAGLEELNDTLLSLISLWKEKKLAFHYITGRMNYTSFFHKFDQLGITLEKNQEIKAYEEDSPLYLAACDAIICSGGATTLAEVSAMGKASIVIPKAYTAGNHQEYNARIVEQHEAGFCITEKELSAEKLSQALDQILNDQALQNQMEQKSRSLFQENCSERIVDEITLQLTKGE